MANTLDPTYRLVPHTDPQCYQCLLCPHESTDPDLFTLHMQQRHAGWMLREPPAEPPPESGAPATSPDSSPPAAAEPEAEPEPEPEPEPESVEGR